MCMYYYREQLNEKEQKAYDALLAGLSKRLPVIHLPRTPLPVSELMQDVILDHPELTDVDFRMFEYADFLFSGMVKVNYLPEDKGAERKLTQIIRLFQERVSDSYDDWDKALIIYDTLGSMIRYGTIDGMSEHTVRGILQKNTAVCDGIAKMYCLLCSACGIDSIVVQGTINAEGHAWNLVKLNGRWKHVDLTGDLKLSESAGVLSHVLFAVADEQVKDHIRDTGKYPACTGENYFEHYQLIADSFLSFASMVRKARKAGRETLNVKFQCASPLTNTKLQLWMTLLSLTGFMSVIFLEKEQIAVFRL